MSGKRDVDIDAVIRDGHFIERILRKAARQAIRLHKRLGNPIAIWRNNKVVWVPPEKIRVPDED